MYHRTHTQIRGGFFSFFFWVIGFYVEKNKFGALPNKTKKKERHLRAALNVGALYMVIVLCHQVWEVRSRVYFFLFFIRKKKKNWKTWQANDDNDEKGDFFKMRFGSCRCIFLIFLKVCMNFRVIGISIKPWNRNRELVDMGKRHTVLFLCITSHK